MDIISKGIDISRWQGNFNMDQAVKEGFQFAILKAGGADAGLYKDSRFEENYEKATRLGIPVGAYWFSKALTVEQARKEAEWFASCLTFKQFELPVYMDVEHRAMLDLGKRQLTDVIHAFCQRMEELGYWAGIYSSQSFFASYMIDSELQRYAHWVACWGKSCSYEGSAFGMWQYGGETNQIRSNTVAGVVCDQNYMLIDYPSMIKAKGLNGFGLPEPEPEPTPAPDPEETKPDFSKWNKVMVFSLEADGETYLTENFQVKEFACQDGSDPVFIHECIPQWCQIMRSINGPFKPNSTYRTVEHNAKPEVGGAARSYHIYGMAVDIQAKKATPEELYALAEKVMGDSGELGIYPWGIHMAVCPEKRRFRG